MKARWLSRYIFAYTHEENSVCASSYTLISAEWLFFLLGIRSPSPLPTNTHWLAVHIRVSKQPKARVFLFLSISASVTAREGEGGSGGSRRVIGGAG